MDFHQPTDPANASAKRFEFITFPVSACVEKGLLRAVVEGRVQGRHYSQQLYEKHRARASREAGDRNGDGNGNGCEHEQRPRKRGRWERDGEVEEVEYWIARYDLRVESDGVSITVTAFDRKLAGSELAVEVAPLSALVGGCR